MLTWRGRYSGRTFQEEETAQPKASEGGFGFLKAFFSCRSCKKKKKKGVAKFLSGTSPMDEEITWEITCLGVKIKMQYLGIRRVATVFTIH